MARRDDDKPESPWTVAFIFFAAFSVFMFLTWLVASHRIVYASLAPSVWAASMWKLVPSDFTFSQWNAVVADVTVFARNPTDVTVVQWGSMVMTAFRPLAVIISLVSLGLLVLVGFRRRPIFNRRLSPDDVIGLSMKHFTGIAPVVAIRKDIVNEKNPKWRRQVTPEEVFQKYTVPSTKLGHTGSLAKPGMSMLRDGKFDREVARSYFMGVTDRLPDGRLISLMLGRQIVNLSVDARKAKAIVFTDRLSSEGKVLAALWGAVAFGGPEGRDDYWKYRDLLNMSAFGSKDGIANLSVAQPLFEKYRKHPLLNKLFAVHHWEHTFLFALLALAQKKGRYTTAEVLWLRPLNRVMFFAMNSRGSYTPHTEAASTFTQYAYEVGCAKAGRLPMMRDEKGLLTHVIYVDKAIDGLELECLRWLEAGEDDDDNWWQKKDIWRSADNTVRSSFENIKSSVPKAPMPGAADEETVFDKLASDEAAKAQKSVDDELSALLGVSGGDN